MMFGSKLMSEDVDLVILDIMLPGISGLKVCEEIRKVSAVPILFLTARSQESDKTIGLLAGGDDYLAKPFSFAELSARVKALLRRYRVPPSDISCSCNAVLRYEFVEHLTSLSSLRQRGITTSNKCWILPSIE